MPWIDIIWTERAEAKIAEHGVTTDEVGQVLEAPEIRELSASTDRMVALGFTAAGRWLAVV